MGLAIGRTDAGASATTDTGAHVIHDHNLLLNLIVLVIIKGNKLAILIEALQSHHFTAADFIAPAAADTFLRVYGLKKIRLP
jgi:hypothetical protein